MVADPAIKKLSSMPFPAIVGQDDLKQVLLLAAAHDDLSGAVITGEKGTAKSTAVRALVDLLPEQQAVADCPYGCAPDDPASQCEDCRARDRDDLTVETRQVPLVTLPLGATRDRVVGTLSVEDAMAGDAEFDPGLLAAANRGILYVDEINLLDDHLVDVLLDAAASGVNTVERDGISVSHPAEFTLIGTMNPEEGDLRPQLRDRFDLQATVTGCQDLADRVDIIDRALAEGDDETVATEYGDAVADLRESLRVARESIDSVSLPTEFKQSIAELCTEAGVDGHRADIATARAAIASAALDGRPKVIESDVQAAARYTLPHRLKSQPFEEPPDPEELLDDHFDDEDTGGEDDAESTDDSDVDESGDAEGADSADENEEAGGSDDGNNSTRDDEAADNGGRDTDSEGSDENNQSKDPAPSGADSGSDSGQADTSERGGDSDDGDDPGSTESDDETEGTPLVPGQQRAGVGDATAPDIDDTVDEADSGENSGSPGQRSHQQQAGGRGTRVRTEPATGEAPVDAAASVRTAASRGHNRVETDDLQQSVRECEQAASIVFAVDASASMTPAMETAKGVVLELLRDAYEQRDEVAFVAFGGDDAEVLLPPTRSVSLAARHLKSLPTGDRTPLPAGLSTAATVLDDADSSLGVAVIITDGRANVADGSPTQATRRAAEQLAGVATAVVVVAAGTAGRGLIPTIVEVAGAETVPLSKLSPQVVTTAVAQAQQAGDAGPSQPES
ncbi:VWA domain-containing protein [Halonotius pteroides]|uniref:Magnesium chelatase n=1 Tax=Halonotius pteroides TaxID=268735 RepID=A0A3A6Q5A0_9EURY|nr:VWA domain-containing protein [Halonotius pteroides]RJX49651.1 magnesium chelatase [Halonotius pteroides]